MNTELQTFKDPINGFIAKTPSRSIAWGLIRNKCISLNLKVPTLDQIEKVEDKPYQPGNNGPRDSSFVNGMTRGNHNIYPEKAKEFFEIPPHKAENLLLRKTRFKEKAKSLVERMRRSNDMPFSYAKQCAMICTKNEYHELREQLINLRSCHVIESEKTYLFRLQELIDDEKAVIDEINNYNEEI